jgi:hypothetical protein
VPRVLLATGRYIGEGFSSSDQCVSSSPNVIMPNSDLSRIENLVPFYEKVTIHHTP